MISGLWTYVGQVLHLQCETDYTKDVFAVAVITDVATAVGHVPYNLFYLVYHFLTRDVNWAVVEITGRYTNRGKGYGLKVPCFLRFHKSSLQVSLMVLHSFKNKVLCEELNRLT